MIQQPNFESNAAFRELKKATLRSFHKTRRRPATILGALGYEFCPWDVYRYPGGNRGLAEMLGIGASYADRLMYETDDIASTRVLKRALALIGTRQASLRELQTAMEALLAKAEERDVKRLARLRDINRRWNMTRKESQIDRHEKEPSLNV